MVNRREKGKRYERHVASLFKAEGYEARRGQQYCGANGDADVVGVPGIHIECKHHERGHGLVYDWLEQAKRDARDDEMPVVITAKNYYPDIVIQEFKDWIQMYREWDSSDDVVHIVRCKECKHQKFYINDTESFYCDQSGVVNMHMEDGDGEFFCKYGERRTEEDA